MGTAEGHPRRPRPFEIQVPSSLSCPPPPIVTVTVWVVSFAADFPQPECPVLDPRVRNIDEARFNADDMFGCFVISSALIFIGVTIHVFEMCMGTTVIEVVCTHDEEDDEEEVTLSVSLPSSCCLLLFVYRCVVNSPWHQSILCNVSTRGADGCGVPG